MNARFGEITRGNGKIFVRILWDEDERTIHATAQAVAKDGTRLPTVLIPFDKCSCVAVLAVFRVGQRLNVTLSDETGTTVATVTRYITPLSARTHSQLNTLRRNPLAEAIRNLDDKTQRETGVSVTFDEYVYLQDDQTDIMHGTVRVVSHRGDFSKDDLELSFFGQFGNVVSDGEWTLLGHTQRDLFDKGLYMEHRIDFSIRIPKDTSTLACQVTAHTPDGTFSRLTCLQEPMLAIGRQRWGALIDSAQTSGAYHDWFYRKQRVSDLEQESQRAASFAIEPTFSFVVPLFKTPIDFFLEMARSVLEQTYAKLELILVNASPEDQELTDAIKTLAENDGRVKVITLERNLGIVGNTYAGVDVATGDFVAFFDHDDIIEPDLLYRYVEGINEYPTTDLLYCDEDKLLDGRLVSPLLKSDWNPDQLLGINYLCHLLTVRRSIVNELPREGLEAFEGSQDHHLTLFAGERARNVYHARKVLYHWRMHEQSIAMDAESKTYTEDAGVRAVQAHLDRCNIQATARLSGVLPNTYHVDYEIRDNPLISIIIPNKDMADILDRCISSILQTSTYDNYEIVVVENNSTDEGTFAYYEELVQRDPRIRVVRHEADGSFNFSRTVNYGAQEARGDLLLLLNNDCEVISPNWLELMAGPLMRSDMGAVGAKLLYPDGLLQHVGVLVQKERAPYHVHSLLPADTPHYYMMAQLIRDFSAVSAACMMVRKKTFEAVGGFDEQLATDYNDADFCLRLRKQGLLVMYEPEAQLMHYEALSRGRDLTPARSKEQVVARGIMMQRWCGYLAEGDSYYHPGFGTSAYYQLEP